MESPVWIEGCRRQLDRLLVAIDPFAPADNMQRLLETGSLLSSLARAELFALHAWDARGEHLLLQHGSVGYASSYVEGERERAAAQFDAQLCQCPERLDAKHRLGVRGPVTQVIADVVRGRDIDVVIVGASHRARVARAVYGRTAARLADALPCHVLALPSTERIDDRALPRAIALRRAA